MTKNRSAFTGIEFKNNEIVSDDPGEIVFFNSIKDSCKVILDVGSADNSIFLNHTSIVHYFEPIKDIFNSLTEKESNNIKSYYNNFGLSDKNETLRFYDNVASFVDRTQGLSKTTSLYNGNDLVVKRGEDYITENSIDVIDFLKIDVEGFELNVLKGFGEKIKNIRWIQFEYGTGLTDCGYGLLDIVNYLKEFGFSDFAYLSSIGPVILTDFTDNFQPYRLGVSKHTWTGGGWDAKCTSVPPFCNIVAFNTNFK